MNGLTISIVHYNNLEKYKDFRFDAEFFKPEYLALETILQRSNYTLFGDVVKEIRCGPFGSTLLADTYLKDGVIVARPFNIKQFTLERDNLVYINQRDCIDKNLRFYEEGDIFFSRVGDIRCGIVPQIASKLTISPNIIAVKPDKKALNPYYATIFFNSKFGLPQIERGLKVVAQPTIQTDLVAELKVVLLSASFQRLIEHLFSMFLELDEKAKILYTNAEQFLLSELGLTDWQPTQQTTFVRNFSEFLQADRLDAEYFQPKYEHVISAITSKTYCTINDILVFNRRGVQPQYTEDGPIKVVTSKHIGSETIEYDQLDHTTEEEWQKNTLARITPMDILIYTTGANVGRTQCFLEHERAIASNHVNILRIKELNPVYAALFLNSLVGQMQVQRMVSGSAQVELYPSNIAQFVIWNAPREIQTEIARFIQTSHTARKQSKHLLDIAKRGVELAIEQDEQRAEAWIQAQIQTLDIEMDQEG